MCWWEFDASSIARSRLVDMPAFVVVPTTLVIGPVFVVPTTLVVGLVVVVPITLVVGLVMLLLLALGTVSRLANMLVVELLVVVPIIELALMLVELDIGLEIEHVLVGFLVQPTQLVRPKRLELLLQPGQIFVVATKLELRQPDVLVVHVVQ